MHCPKCGQLQVSDETRFCSRCGFLLTGVTEVVSRGGVLPVAAAEASRPTPRSRGLKQGLFIFLLSFLVVPIIAILTVAANAEPYAVVLSAILLGVGGLLRAAYAFMFESGEPVERSHAVAAGEAPNYIAGQAPSNALPPQRSVPAGAYASPAGRWRDTNDLQKQPSSVTDSTTKLLQNESDDQ